MNIEEFLKQHKCEPIVKNEFLDKKYEVYKCYTKSNKPIYVSLFYPVKGFEPIMEIYNSIEELIDDLYKTRIILDVDKEVLEETVLELIEKLNKEKKL